MTRLGRHTVRPSVAGWRERSPLPTGAPILILESPICGNRDLEGERKPERIREGEPPFALVPRTRTRASLARHFGDPLSAVGRPARCVIDRAEPDRGSRFSPVEAD
jgi:hypothetical protein